MKKFIPHKQVTVKTNDKPWIIIIIINNLFSQGNTISLKKITVLHCCPEE